MKTLSVATLDEWHDWLAEHHASATEIWLVYYKKDAGVESIVHSDALDEALCFGWIDSLIKRIDDKRYAMKFTPRKADSRWSDVNRERYAALKASGRLTPAGIKRAPTDKGSAPRPKKMRLPRNLPAYIDEALKKRPAVLRNFEALPPNERRRYVAWIETAERDETKLRRLKEAIRKLALGETLGLK